MSTGPGAATCRFDTSSEPGRRIWRGVQDIRTSLGAADRPVLDAALAEFSGPLRVAVTGRPGTGRDTMARAVRIRFGVAPIGPGDDASAADLWLHVLVGAVREADLRLLAAAPTSRTVVALGKADTSGEWESAVAAAAECAARVGRSVTPVSALLATADLTDEEYACLVALVRSGDDIPSMAASFVDGDREERRVRVGLLRRVDQFGLSWCVSRLYDRGPSQCSAQWLTDGLIRQSRFEDLDGPIRATLAAVRAARMVRLRTVLERLAAGDAARDDIEHLLQGMP